jgi:hypothetical protein
MKVCPPSYPRVRRGTEDVEVGDTGCLTSFSTNGEYTSESHEYGF